MILMFLIILTLPFTNTLVINIGFPLKIYEIVGILLCFMALISVIMRKKFILLRSEGYSIYMYPLIAFIAWYAFSGIVGIYRASDIVMPIWALGRNTLTNAVLMKLLYVLLNCFLFGFFIANIRSKERLIRVIRWWISASVIVSLYAIYLFITSAMHSNPWLLPGTLSVQYGFLPGIGEFIRCATFKEGNFYGGYMNASLMMILPFLFTNTIPSLFQYKKLKWYYFIIMVSGLLISASTINIVVFVVLMCAYLWSIRVRKHSIKIKLMFLFIGILLFGIIFISTPAGKTMVINKIFSNDVQMSMSKRDRLGCIVTATKMALVYPVIGVGPTNFGLYYDRFKLDGMVAGTGEKRIANNIYAEILCETGFTGLALFLAYLFSIRYLYKKQSKIIDHKLMPLVKGLYFAFISMLIVFMAFPTFTLTFHWILIGLLIASINIGVMEKRNENSL